MFSNSSRKIECILRETSQNLQSNVERTVQGGAHRAENCPKIAAFPCAHTFSVKLRNKHITRFPFLIVDLKNQIKIELKLQIPRSQRGAVFKPSQYGETASMMDF